MDYSDATAFITGGASGIGLGMARAFAAAGIRVAIADIRADHLDTARTLFPHDAPVHFLPLDVTDRDAYVRAADEAEAVLGPVSIVCNNAGVGLLGRAQDSRYADWDWAMAVNVGGVINGVQTFLPRMLGRGPGHIVNTSSIGAMLPMPGGAAYVTSKAAIIGLSEALHSDLHDDDIGVTLLIPGPTATNIHQVKRLRPQSFADTGFAGLEAQLDEKPLFDGGLDPLETGRMVLDAIAARQLYLFTHADFREGVAQRLAAIMTGFQGLAQSSEDFESRYGFPAYNRLLADIAAGQQQSD